MNRNSVPSAFRNLKSAAATIAVGCGLFVSLGSDPARAQPMPPGPGGTVSGSGQVTLTRQPNVLRMTMEVSGEGKDVAAALAKLKSEKEQVAAKLKALGAAEASVKFDAPRVGGAGGGGANARARAMQMNRGRGRGAPTTRPGGAAAPEAPKVEVSAKVTAEWPFEGGASAEEVIVAAYNLREKVKAGGLSKKAGKANLTPEEQEELEEMEAMNMNDYGMPGANMPGEPAFVFVSKVPAAERDAATAEAFKKAKEDAARLATAGGAQLGEIRQIAGQSSAMVGDGLDGNDYYGGGGYNYQAQMMRQLGFNVPGSNAEEAAGFEPGPVSLQVTVTATFAIK